MNCLLRLNAPELMEAREVKIFCFFFRVDIIGSSIGNTFYSFGKVFTMRGCTAAGALCEKSFNPAVFLCLQSTNLRECVTAHLEAAENTRQLLEERRQSLMAQRADIATRFDQFQITIESSKRAALTQFDTEVEKILKALEVQVSASEVLARQVTVFCRRDHAAVRQDQVHDKKSPTPTFFFTGMEIVQGMILRGKCWSFAGEEQQEDVGIGRAQCEFLEDMREHVAHMKNALSKQVFEKHIGSDASPQFSLKGHHAVTFTPYNDKSIITGLCISPDASTLAMVDSTRHVIRLYTTLTGQEIRETSCEVKPFHLPGRCCFTPSGDNLLISDVGYSGIQQVTLDGKHVRLIGDELGDVSGFDVNANVFVVCHFNYRRHHPVYVIDFETGKVCRRIAGIEASDIVKLSRDGQLMAFENRRGLSIDTFTLTGEFISRAVVGKDVVDFCFLNFGHIAVTVLDDPMRIYSESGLEIKHAIPSHGDENVCFKNNFLFVWNSKKITVWW